MLNNSKILIFIFLFGFTYAESKIVASDGQIGDRYGSKVDASDQWVVVSANRDDDNGSNSGSVYVYDYEFNEYKIIPIDGVDGDYFGKAISINGDWLIVSSVYDDENGEKAGSVYIFYFNGLDWIQHTKLLAFDGEAYDRFGYSVDIYNEVAVVGSVYDDDMGDDSGSVYIYRLIEDEWLFEQKIVSSTGTEEDFFGISLSVYDDTMAIGSVYDDYLGENSGSAYIFTFDGENWHETQKIFAFDGQDYNFFGNAVDLHSGNLVIGSFYDDVDYNNSGSVYIYNNVNGYYQFNNKLSAFDNSLNDNFGHSLSIYNRWIAVGSLNNDNGINSGSVYLYEISSNSEIIDEVKINASDGNANDEFSVSVSLENERLIVGSHFDDDLGDESGSVYMFDYLGCRDMMACNYNGESVFENNEICEYAYNGFDCSGECEYLVDECGVCNGSGNSGDANFDGSLNIADIVILVEYIIVSLPDGYINDCVSDLNQDDIVNITDLILIVEQILSQ